MGLLADFYSTLDSTKRKVADFAANPVESTRHFFANQNEDAGKQLGLLSQSFTGADGRATMGPRTPQAQAAHNQLTDNMTAAMMGATVWHGSPHKFNQFDSSKIGTGEGAQAYGHGLYLAESRDVAGSYQAKLTDDAFKYKAMNEAKVRVHEKLAQRVEATDPARAAALRAEVASLGEPGGSLYKVDLPDQHIAKMLDWDKPLSGQSAGLQAALQPMFGPKSLELTGQEIYKKATGFDQMTNVARVAGANADSALKRTFPGITDAQISQAIGSAKQSLSRDKSASSMLRDAGIPGIRYLDGGSRGAGAGSSNYVVFPGNEGLLNILERNGAPIK